MNLLEFYAIYLGLIDIEWNIHINKVQSIGYIGNKTYLKRIGIFYINILAHTQAYIFISNINTHYKTYISSLKKYVVLDLR